MKKRILKLAIAIFLGTISITSCGGEKANTESHEHTAEYQCPMDCEDGKTYDKPGECAVCNMPLKEVDHEH